MSSINKVRKSFITALLAAVFVFGALIGAVVLPASASALGTAPVPVALDAAGNGNPPLIAYDSVTQTTYVAWANGQGTGVDLCVLPSSATSCEGGAPRSEA